MPPDRSADPPANSQNLGRRANANPHPIPNHLARPHPARYHHFTPPYPFSGPAAQLENVVARTPTTFNLPYIHYHQALPAPVYVTQPSIVQSPYHKNTPTVVYSNVDGTFAPKLPPAAYSPTTLGVDVQTPKYTDGAFAYRRHVIVRLSLTGTVLLQFNQVVLGPTHPNESQLALWCFAQCGSCTSSQYPQCNPIGWYLNPLHDPKHSQGFMLNPSSGTLTGNVTFNIQHRPRQPKAQDQTRRCNSESLMLKFSLCDSIGHVIVEKQVGPFRARSHTKKVRQNETTQQPVDAPHHLGSRGIPIAVPSFPASTQAPSPMLPVEYSAPMYAPAFTQDPRLPCSCAHCQYRTMQYRANG